MGTNHLSIVKEKMAIAHRQVSHGYIERRTKSCFMSIVTLAERERVRLSALGLSSSANYAVERQVSYLESAILRVPSEADKHCICWRDYIQR